FMTLLAAPPRGTITLQELIGELIFEDIGCANCHTPTLFTGPSPIAALSNQEFHPFSDFLLHDMGSTGDGIRQNNATGRLMRTSPLWGIRLQRNQGTRLMHDGQTTTFRGAIARHFGQGSFARINFNALFPAEQNAVIAFLFSL